MADDLAPALARTMLEARTRLGLSAAALAERSGVSRAMISRIERGEAHPTAVLLGRLSGALGMTLSELIALAEGGDDPLTRAADQPVWTDPATGYSRRAVSRPSDAALELVEVSLPPGAEVGYPAEAYRFLDQLVWMLAGSLRIRSGAQVHDLSPGDCLRFGPPQDTAFINPSDSPARYLVVLGKRGPRT
ncbi:XRE family transcriptional regulator [Kocuria palustris]|uniref:helix-turn-helix domain-containing protein n=1 Tax=Kocuria palustris TaxID=71999 RepID=UPI0011A11AFE|nr:XRE family transcriptional regulator [Kocuria palustris]